MVGKYISRYFKKSFFRILLENVHYLRGYLPWHLTRFITLLDFRLLSGRSFGPIFVNLELTARCNLKCKTCFLAQGPSELRSSLSEELSTGAIKGVIDEISYFRPFINICGGEPFVRSDLLTIVKYIKGKNLFCDIVTNGTLISEAQIEEILESRLDMLTFSLDGPEEVNDLIRGNGTFRKVITTIRQLIKRRGNKYYPLVCVNFTISSYNYRNLQEMIDICRGLGIDRLNFSHLWFVSPECAEVHRYKMKRLFGINCRYIDGYIADTKSINADILINEIHQIRKNKNIEIAFFPNLSPSEIKRYYDSPSSPIKSRCFYPWFFVSIKSNGDVVPCPDYIMREYILGNISRERFSDIWNGEKAKLFRTTLKQEKIFPACLRCCGLFKR